MKKWFLLGTITFSVGFTLSLIVIRDLKKSSLNGLFAIPAAFVGVSVVEHQRKKNIIDDGISFLEKQVENLSIQELKLKINNETLKEQKSNLESELHQELQNLEKRKQVLEGGCQKLEQYKVALEETIAQLQRQIEAQKQEILEDCDRLIGHFQELKDLVNRQEFLWLITHYSSLLPSRNRSKQ
jgi:DNA repair exonuclease SbcCD ATPase subunit